MSDGSKIEWTDATVNAINGCSLASPGCTNCYAMRLAGTRMKHHPSRKGLTIDTKAGPVWNGEVRLVETALLQPLRWRRSRIIFWNAHGDAFHPAVPDDWLWRMFDVIRGTQDLHQHLILTKRSARMVEFVKRYTALPSDINHFYGKPESIQLYQPLRNTWYGTSAEDQPRADERIAELLPIAVATARGAGLFVSFEPLLGSIEVPNLHLLDGAIVGGESGPGARPMHPDWARSLRDQCADAGVDFHFKQWGNIAPLLSARPVAGEGAGIVAWPDGTIGAGHSDRNGGAGQQMYRAEKKIAGRHLDGLTHDALPWTREA